MPKAKPVNFLFTNGGVGDHVSSLVAIAYITNRYPQIKPLVWVPDFMLEFSQHLLPKRAIVNNFTSMPKLYDRNLPTKTTSWDGIVSPMKIHCLDYAFLKLCDENPSIEHKNFLQIRPNEILYKRLPSLYVVITTGYTAKVREFKSEHVNEVTTWLKDSGITPVFLGQTQTPTGGKFVIEGKFDSTIDFDDSINLIDQTSLLQATKIMSNARAVIGVDNGLLHVAGCTKVPIIGGFTTVTPEIRMPVRNNILGWNYYPVVPDKDLACSFCQEKTNFLYGHDYKNCYTKKLRCTNQMTSEKFINQLKRVMQID